MNGVTLSGPASEAGRDTRCIRLLSSANESATSSRPAARSMADNSCVAVIKAARTAREGLLRANLDRWQRIGRCSEYNPRGLAAVHPRHQCDVRVIDNDRLTHRNGFLVQRCRARQS